MTCIMQYTVYLDLLISLLISSILISAIFANDPTESITDGISCVKLWHFHEVAKMMGWKALPVNARQQNISWILFYIGDTPFAVYSFNFPFR